MKTKNNVQKAILRSVAVVLSFVLLSFTVNAQDFWKNLMTNSSFGDIATAMVETKNENLSVESDSEKTNFIVVEQAVESNLELEDWMMDEFYFMEYMFQPEFEKPMELENWMTNEDIFETEEPLVMEDWMVSEEVWNL